MIEVPTDLQVNQPTVTVLGNTFVSIENYKSILEYDVNLKHITDTEIGIKGIIYSVEYTT